MFIIIKLKRKRLRSAMNGDIKRRPDLHIIIPVLGEHAHGYRFLHSNFFENVFLEFLFALFVFSDVLWGLVRRGRGRGVVVLFVQCGCSSSSQRVGPLICCCVCCVGVDSVKNIVVIPFFFYVYYYFFILIIIGYVIKQKINLFIVAFAGIPFFFYYTYR